MQYFEIAAGLLAPLLAATVIWTSILQYHLNKQKLKAELYTERMRVFEAMMGYIASVTETAGVSPGGLVGYLRATRRGHFLFDRKRRSHLSRVYDMLNALQFANQQVESLHDSPEQAKYQEAVEKEHNLLGWFSSQSSVAPPLFRKYIGFK